MNYKILSDCEAMIMQCIWHYPNETLTLPVINELVNSKYGLTWKSQTVSTYLARLVKKEFLQSTRTGRTFIYTPLVSFKQYVEVHSQRFDKFWYDEHWPTNILKVTR